MSIFDTILGTEVKESLSIKIHLQRDLPCECLVEEHSCSILSDAFSFGHMIKMAI